jgi:hypothetical protein
MSRRPEGIPPEALGPPSQPDLGARYGGLHPSLVEDYVVESYYGDDVARLIVDNNLVNRLHDAVQPLREQFGSDVRLMLSAPWHLKEPVHRLVQVVIYTRLGPEAADQAKQRFEADWESGHPSAVKFVVSPLGKLHGD